MFLATGIRSNIKGRTSQLLVDYLQEPLYNCEYSSVLCNMVYYLHSSCICPVSLNCFYGVCMYVCMCTLCLHLYVCQHLCVCVCVCIHVLMTAYMWKLEDNFQELISSFYHHRFQEPNLSNYICQQEPFTCEPFCQHP